MYFCGYFDKPATYKTFLSKGPDSQDLEWYEARQSVEFSQNRLGAVFTFPGETNVQSRIGVSFISTDKACANVNHEITETTTLEDLRDDTRKEWEDQVLSKITTTETDPELLARLYSAMYFMNLLPQNKTGENPLWESQEPYYDDTFTFWDTVRITCPSPNAYRPSHARRTNQANRESSSDARLRCSTFSCRKRTKNFFDPGSISGGTKASCPMPVLPFGTALSRADPTSTTC